MRYLLSLVLLLSFISCSKKEKEPTHFRGIAMTMPYDIQVSDKISKKQQDMIKACISTIFSQIDNSLNHWNPNSEVNNLHSNKMRVSDHLKAAIQHSKFVHALSKRRYDPSLYHEIKSWKESLDLGVLPERKQSHFMSLMDSVHVKGNTLSLESTHVKFDFDGITKGYTIDLIVASLQEMGFKNIFVNWSGEIKAVGKYDKKRAWKVLVANPEDLDNTQEIFDLDSMAIATSGDYQQSWQVNDKVYTHFINPKTLSAKQVKPFSLSSVTVRHNSCTIADALATAAMTFDDREALNNWISEIESQLKDVKFWVFYHDRQARD